MSIHKAAQTLQESMALKLAFVASTALILPIQSYYENPYPELSITPTEANVIKDLYDNDTQP